MQKLRAPHIQISARDVKRAAGYALLPGILPRLKALGLGFPSVAFWMAHLFAGCRLLPYGHVFLDSRNIGQYGIISVFAVVMGNLRFRWSHIDQLLIFAALALAFLTLVVQIVLFIGMLATGVAFANTAAQPLNPFTGLFDTRHPSEDMAFLVLDKIFQIPGFFGSANAPVGATAIDPFQKALHELFRYYNYGMMVVGGIIVLYFIVVVTLETAQTGTPFGQRFNSVYAPMRLVLAVMIILPLGYGLNAGQYAVLWAAKWGSGLASNAWISFSKLASDGPTSIVTGEPDRSQRAADENAIISPQSMIALPQAADVRRLVQFLHLALACSKLYEAQYPSGAGAITIKPYLVRWMDFGDGMGTRQELVSGITFERALAFSGSRNITIRFGHFSNNENYEAYKSQLGNVYPYCGEIKIELFSIQNPGSLHINQVHFDQIKTFWNDNDHNAFVAALIANAPDQAQQAELKKTYLKRATDYQSNITRAVAEGREKLIEENAFSLSDEYLKKGWAAAGLFTNAIASQSSAYLSAAYRVPDVTHMPAIMERVRQIRARLDATVVGAEIYSPQIEGRGTTPGEAEASVTNSDLAIPSTPTSGERERQIATDLHRVYLSLLNEERGFTDLNPSGNFLIDTINLIFGTEALFSFRENAEVHPIVKLAALGKGIMEHTVTAFMGTLGLGFGGGFISAFEKNIGATAGAFSSLMMTVAMIGMTAGFILFYIVPFLPFMYFFFAVLKWIQSVFEAMVGIPLWALAHLRIQGQGLPGNAAGNGYFMILEIFLRPILIIISMLASFIIFSAMAVALEEMYDVARGTFLASEDIANGNLVDMARGHVDMLFMTILYVIIIYMLGMSTFKLIDQFPNGVLRWIGSSAKSELAGTEDVGKFLDYTFIVPAMEAVEQTVKGTQTLASRLPETVMKEMNRQPPRPSSPE